MKSVLRFLVWLSFVTLLAWQALSPDSWTIRQIAAVLHPDTEVELGLSARLWRHGLDWTALDASQQQLQREAVIQALRNDHLIRAARLKTDGDQAIGHAAYDELSRFQKMLGYATDRYEQALINGLMTEAAFERSVRDQQLDERWLASRSFAPPRDQDVLSWYQTHRTALTVPQAYHAKHLFLSAHEPGKPDRLAEMQTLARKGVAADSEDERTRHRAGDLGWFTAARMPAAFMAAVQALRPGETSMPVRTQLGWHVITLVETRPARVPELDEVKAEITAMLGNHLGGKLGHQVLEQVRQGLTPPDLGLPYE